MRTKYFTKGWKGGISMSNEFKNLLDHQLSALEWNQTDSYAVLQKVRGGFKVKKKMSAAVILAMVLMLVLLGAAVAASLGVFGQLAGDESNGNKLQNLENVSKTYGQTQTAGPLAAADVQASKAEDVYSQVLAHQKERAFEFTLEQAHFDGKTITISYTFREHGNQDIILGEGMPSGDIPWNIQKQGKADGSNIFGDQELNKKITDHLNTHDSAYVMIDFASLGDGFFLSDGSDLDITDSGSKELADGRTQGYGEYQGIPEAFKEADSIETSMHIIYGTEIVYQDANGYKEAVVMNPEDRGLKDIRFTILHDGKTLIKSGEAAFEKYSVKAELTISQVDISATLTMKCPGDWTRVWTQMGEFKAEEDYVYDYALYAGGKLCKETDCGIKVIAPDQLEMRLRYELPASYQELTLRPVYMRGGEKTGEDVAIK
jgi:hypothetical protein